MNSNPNLISGDRRWILQIRQTIDEDIEEDDIDFPVSIFNVPTSLVSTKPDCYIPQQVALGPYHHWRPELYEMERFKISAARRYQKQLQDGGLKFEHIVDQLAVFEPRIRACYHKYLDFDGETLIWMMALDASFLIGFLDVYAIENGFVMRFSSRTLRLGDFSCRRFAYDAILRDIVMLENQIPIFLLEKMLEFQFHCLESAQKSLTSMLVGFCKEVSPLRVITDVRQVLHSTHVLGFLYHMIVDPIMLSHNQQEEEEEETRYNFFKGIINGVQRFLERLKHSEPVKLIEKFSPAIVSNVPVVRIFKHHVFKEDKQVLNVDQRDHKPPLTEEISIPSVTDLSKAGFRFSPSAGGIFTINFDANSSVFFLPVLSLDVNTDVVLRNLIAYEACNASGPLILTRYTELMNGIIDTKEDAKLLRERGIMVNRLKNDEEVANLWNGMSRSVRLTKVPFLDKVIEDVNKNYERTLRVRIEKLMKVYVVESWQFLVYILY
ncbi:Protein of unknown function DUF247, plant [Cynara cardunculus var. scolymus]|uniref:Uncharacterized protein n=1 Tax=Cynara cardunculus var. scolymus TaxID=59895 RepID=A0A103XWB0_CYNCS|nr:Protein of unknown function DUF247, plant [Cynara cardunculus var. scolymus]